MNATSSDNFHPGPLFIFVFVVLWVLALALNVTSSVLLWKETRSRPSWANILLLCIALIDVLVLICVITPAIIALFVSNLLKTTTGLCFFQGCGLNIFILYSSFLAVYVSLDQYLAFCHPFKYNSRVLRYQARSHRIIVIVLSVLFMVSAVLSILPKLTGADFGPLDPPLLCYYNLHSSRLSNKVFSSVNTSLILLSSFVLLFCCVSIGHQFCHTHRNLVKYSISQVAGPHRTAVDRQQKGLVKMSIITAVVYLSCSLPFEVKMIKLALLELKLP